jgi:tRNA-Thr(GGU) m(6)t(6)A37 methyltransferase TsaA
MAFDRIVAGLLVLVLGAWGTGMCVAETCSLVICPVGQVHVGPSGPSIEVAPRYQDALAGLEGFSNVWVIWWFDRNETPSKRSILKVHPRGDPGNPLTGVFATRSPVRPNLIGLTLCRVRSIRGTTIRVESIDAFDGTPVLDLKPYIPDVDGEARALVPSWVVQDPGDR